MQNRRKDRDHSSPELEDAGLFRVPTRELVVVLTPRVRGNRRSDVIIDGFVIDDRNEMVPVELLFSGRRARSVRPMLARLKQFAAEAASKAAKAGRPEPALDEIRMPMQAKGSWRNRFTETSEGLQDKYLQFVIAQWALLDPGQPGKLYGAPPVHEVRKERTPAPRP